MKILMLGWELPPLNSGGLGVACYQMCQHLARSGIKIDFVMPFAMPDSDKPDFMNIHCVSQHEQPDFISGYANFSANIKQKQKHYIAKVEQLLKRNNYDAIHCHDWLTLQAGVFAKKTTGLPLVAHVHSTEFDRSGMIGGNPVVHDIEYNCLLMADKIVAVSNITKNILIQKYKIPASKIDVVHSGINASDLAAGADSSYVYLKNMKQRGYKVVVSLGRLTVQKGLYYLLYAAAMAIKQDPKIIFLIVGDGEQKNELIRLSAELKISENVIFTGFLRGKKWRDAYRIGDMFVMSSVSEPYGLTALESACVGTPVIMTKQSGVSEVLTNALRFDFWDTAKLADYILNVSSQSALATELAKNAQKEVQGVTWQKCVTQLISIYAASAKEVA